ncbi:MAG TPA: amidohydrolase family protein [Pirellulales bacterium]|jgi:L-fuconolactonase|nr:amidohydrolase family protein [Pirellulales bacterium]
MPLTIDAHQHFWQLDRREFDYRWLDAPPLAPIRRDFMPPDLRPLIERVHVDRTVFVQTQHQLAENRWALALAEKYPFIAGVVGWVDLASPQCAAQVEEFRAHARFVGVRHVTQDEPDDNFIVRDDVIRGLKVLEKQALPFDLLFYARHLKHAPTLAERLPDLPMVIDHLAKPKITERRFDEWLADFRAAARYPNLCCKLSGMVTEADWKTWQPADLKPYVQAALELFGPNRLMFGSDWPVCELAGSYDRVYYALVEALGPISEAERGAIFGGTAARFYKLPG